MSRLIDADALENEFGISDADIIAKDAIRDAPTIDAVPVVRCKDCKFRKPTFNGEDYFCTVWDADDSETAYVTDNDFCSYGERKEGADNG